jgi:hypothetical protein
MAELQPLHEPPLQPHRFAINEHCVVLSALRIRARGLFLYSVQLGFDTRPELFGQSYSARVIRPELYGVSRSFGLTDERER